MKKRTVFLIIVAEAAVIAATALITLKCQSNFSAGLTSSTMLIYPAPPLRFKFISAGTLNDVVCAGKPNGTAAVTQIELVGPVGETSKILSPAETRQFMKLFDEVTFTNGHRAENAENENAAVGDGGLQILMFHGDQMLADLAVNDRTADISVFGDRKYSLSKKLDWVKIRRQYGVTAK